MNKQITETVKIGNSPKSITDHYGKELFEKAIILPRQVLVGDEHHYKITGHDIYLALLRNDCFSLDCDPVLKAYLTSTNAEKAGIHGGYSAADVCFTVYCAFARSRLWLPYVEAHELEAAIQKSEAALFKSPWDLTGFWQLEAILTSAAILDWEDPDPLIKFPCYTDDGSKPLYFSKEAEQAFRIVLPVVECIDQAIERGGHMPPNCYKGQTRGNSFINPPGMY